MRATLLILGGDWLPGRRSGIPLYRQRRASLSGQDPLPHSDPSAAADVLNQFLYIPICKLLKLCNKSSASKFGGRFRPNAFLDGISAHNRAAVHDVYPRPRFRREEDLDAGIG